MSSDSDSEADEPEINSDIRTRLRKQTQNVSLRTVTNDLLDELIDTDSDEGDISFDDSDDSDYTPENCPNRTRKTVKDTQVSVVKQKPVTLDNFQLGNSDVVDITCAGLRAKLQHRLFACPGIYSECIQYDGKLLTPKSFCNLGGMANSKDWKRSIQINGKPIRQCMNEGLLDFYNHKNLCTGRCGTGRSWTSHSLISNGQTTLLCGTPVYATPLNVATSPGHTTLQTIAHSRRHMYSQLPTTNLAATSMAARQMMPLASSSHSITNSTFSKNGNVLASNSPLVQSQVHQESMTQLNSEDALSYFDLVRVHFGDESPIYQSFLSTLKEFMLKSITAPEMVRKLFELFKDHPNLLSGLNTLLPPSFKIKIEDNEIEVYESLPSPPSQQQQQLVSGLPVDQKAQSTSFGQLQKPVDPNMSTTPPSRVQSPKHVNHLSHSQAQGLLNNYHQQTNILQEPNMVHPKTPETSNHPSIMQTKEIFNFSNQQTNNQQVQKQVEVRQPDGPNHFPAQEMLNNSDQQTDNQQEQNLLKSRFPKLHNILSFSQTQDTTINCRQQSNIEQKIKPVEPRTIETTKHPSNMQTKEILNSSGQQTNNQQEQNLLKSKFPKILNILSISPTQNTPNNSSQRPNIRPNIRQDLNPVKPRTTEHPNYPSFIQTREMLNYTSKQSNEQEGQNLLEPSPTNSCGDKKPVGIGLLNLDLYGDVLHVRCGKLRAKFHRKLYICSRIASNCIEYNGEFMPPMTLLRIANKHKVKDWKGSLFFYGKPLRQYFDVGLLDYYNHQTQCDLKCKTWSKERNPVESVESNNSTTTSLSSPLMNNSITTSLTPPVINNSSTNSVTLPLINNSTSASLTTSLMNDSSNTSLTNCSMNLPSNPESCHSLSRGEINATNNEEDDITEIELEIGSSEAYTGPDEIDDGTETSAAYTGPDEIDDDTETSAAYTCLDEIDDDTETSAAYTCPDEIDDDTETSAAYTGPDEIDDDTETSAAYTGPDEIDDDTETSAAYTCPDEIDDDTETSAAYTGPDEIDDDTETSAAYICLEEIDDGTETSKLADFSDLELVSTSHSDARTRSWDIIGTTGQSGVMLVSQPITGSSSEPVITESTGSSFISQWRCGSRSQDNLRIDNQEIFRTSNKPLISSHSRHNFGLTSEHNAPSTSQPAIGSPNQPIIIDSSSLPDTGKTNQPWTRETFYPNATGISKSNTASSQPFVGSSKKPILIDESSPTIIGKTCRPFIRTLSQSYATGISQYNITASSQHIVGLSQKPIVVDSSNPTIIGKTRQSLNGITRQRNNSITIQPFVGSSSQPIIIEPTSPTIIEATNQQDIGAISRRNTVGTSRPVEAWTKSLLEHKSNTPSGVKENTSQKPSGVPKSPAAAYLGYLSNLLDMNKYGKILNQFQQTVASKELKKTKHQTSLNTVAHGSLVRDCRQLPTTQEDDGFLRKFTEEGMLFFLAQVKSNLGERNPVYFSFVNILKEFTCRRIDAQTMVTRLQNILKDLPILLEGFNKLLPPEYQLSIRVNERRVKSHFNNTKQLNSDLPELQILEVQPEKQDPDEGCSVCETVSSTTVDKEREDIPDENFDNGILSFLDEIKANLGEQSPVYVGFLDIMLQYKCKRIDTPNMFKRLVDLMKDHPKLLERFKKLVHHEYENVETNQTNQSQSEHHTVYQTSELDQTKQKHSQLGHETVYKQPEKLITVASQSDGETILPTTQEDEGFLRKLTEEGMLSFLAQVKSNLGEQNPVYFRFVNVVMEFTCSRIDAPSMVIRLQKVLKNHPILLKGLNKLLPPEFQLNIQADSVESGDKLHLNRTKQMNLNQQKLQTVGIMPEERFGMEDDSVIETASDSFLMKMFDKGILSFLVQMKANLGYESPIYYGFLKIMSQYKSKRIDAPNMVKRLLDLLKDHPKLLEGLKKLVHHAYEVNVETNQTNPNRLDHGTVDQPIEIDLTHKSQPAHENVKKQSEKEVLVAGQSGCVTINYPEAAIHQSETSIQDTPKDSISILEESSSFQKESSHSPKESSSILEESSSNQKESGSSPNESGIIHKERSSSQKESSHRPKESQIILEESVSSTKEDGCSPNESGLSPKESGFDPKEMCSSLKEIGFSPIGNGSTLEVIGSSPNKSGSCPKESVSSQKESGSSKIKRQSDDKDKNKTVMDVLQTGTKRPLLNTAESRSAKRKSLNVGKDSSKKVGEYIVNVNRSFSVQQDQLDENHATHKACATKIKQLQKLVYTCDTCNKKCDRLYDLMYHVKTHFAHENRERFKCVYCAKEFISKSGKNRHERTHMGEMLYKCHRCDKDFRTQSRLNKHKYDEHNCRDLTFLCDICGKELKTKCIYNQHLLIHGEKTVQCQYCTKRFCTKLNLRFHMKQNHKKLPCNVCSEVFQSKQELKRHKMTHFKKEYQCDQCEASFSQNCNLTKHRIIHLGLKPYKCHMCKCAYAHRSNLNAHMKRAHDLKPQSTGWIGLRVQK